MTSLLDIRTATDWLVLCDFDETFFAHDTAVRSSRDLADLAALVNSLSTSRGLRFGFITGSSPSTVTAVLDDLGTSLRPAFIGGNLGTELLVVDHTGELVPDPGWQARFPSPEEFSVRVDRALAAVPDLVLTPQATHGAGLYKRNFYLRAESDDLDADGRVRSLRQATAAEALAVNINHCNPAAGDPVGYLDVDFLPLGAGKREIACFLQQSWQVPASRTLAFGDSGNDLGMLACASHAWLVANATGEARKAHPYVTARPHAGGIVDTIANILTKEQ